jgi:cob(I)alamin adenosyltransferase
MRLTKITTKNGDNGTTSTADGAYVLKSSTRMQAIGDIDELNTFVGLLFACITEYDDCFDDIKWIMNRLFDLGGEIASDKHIIRDEEIERLENISEKINENLPPLKNFILPGISGNEKSSRAHVCRSVTRRAERSLVALRQEMKINDKGMIFLNRLSDYFFILSRDLSEGNEVVWEPIEKPKIDFNPNQ